ncbi:transposase [Sphaerisporangium album]|uniref:Transposase n=1 Tax=Sphaerisporangium album TaxID=509200 RepID=A0A367FJX6_9ACTN|nr:transposase [Sphaerisporangium album]RCG30561.1 transposase [Sphaerisporangium album]
MSRWVGAAGHEVEAVRLNGRSLLRVSQYGYVVAYCRSVAEVAGYVDLGDLVEVVTLPARDRRPSI